MEYQKVKNLLDNTPNQPTKSRTKYWVEINDDAQIKYKTSVLKLSLYDYSDAYILVTGTITVPHTGTAASPNNRKNIKINNCTPFTDCISEINNTQIDNAKDTDIVMLLLLIFLLMIIAVLHLILKQKWQAELEMMVEKMLNLWYH